jgi:NAD(P)-dependent dehydrogenase (short-subunit alcohol dehydrogenase family)
VSRPVALVTGARRGIGRAIAVALAGRGFDLVLNDLAPSEEIAETAREVATAGATATLAFADIGDLQQHAGLLDAAWAAGPVACLVNNAGVSVAVRGDLLDVGVDSYDRCQDVNTRGTFFLTQAFARRMLVSPDPGAHRSIVIVSSSNAEAVAVQRGEYCVSKAALAMVAKLFAVRLAADGIGVYEIRPGIIATEMTAPSKERYDAFFAAGRNPVPRWGRPEEVGRCVAACAAGDLPYTAGQVIKVDGGLTIPHF